MALRFMIRPLQQRVRDWALRRQGPDSLPLTLSSRRIYILPTRAGWTFAVLIAVTFAAGMNYGNGLALLLCFWLAGFALVAMVQTQQTLAGARLLAAAARPAFAGETVMLQLQMESLCAVEDLFHLPAGRRGLWRAPVLKIESRAPYELFRTWTWLRLDVQTYVYPRPAGNLAVPETSGEEPGSRQSAQNADELAWLRNFRDGDSPRQVAWKAYARGAPLLVREYRGYAAAAREFDYALLAHLDVESRLSQLCRWIVDAAQRNESWTLRLPGASPLHGSGPEHLALCLRQLALFGVRDIRA
jgi:uncharacterized protein (DUF58 family)